MPQKIKSWYYGLQLKSRATILSLNQFEIIGVIRFCRKYKNYSLKKASTDISYTKYFSLSVFQFSCITLTIDFYFLMKQCFNISQVPCLNIYDDMIFEYLWWLDIGSFLKFDIWLFDYLWWHNIFDDMIFIYFWGLMFSHFWWHYIWIFLMTWFLNISDDMISRYFGWKNICILHDVWLFLTTYYLYFSEGEILIFFWWHNISDYKVLEYFWLHDIWIFLINMIF